MASSIARASLTWSTKHYSILFFNCLEVLFEIKAIIPHNMYIGPATYEAQIVAIIPENNNNTDKIIPLILLVSLLDEIIPKMSPTIIAIKDPIILSIKFTLVVSVASAAVIFFPMVSCPAATNAPPNNIPTNPTMLQIIPITAAILRSNYFYIFLRLYR